MSAPPSTLQLDGVLRIFGYSDTEADLTAIPRSTRWRAIRAARAGGAGYALMLLTPLPPHLGWLMGGFGAGTFFGIRKWNERFTLTDLDGVCPRCTAALPLASPTRLRAEMTLDCPGCGHAVTLKVSMPEPQG